MSSSPTDGRISLGSAMSGSPVARQHHCCRIDPLPPSLPAFGKQAHRPSQIAPVIGCGQWLARLRFLHCPVVCDLGGPFCFSLPPCPCPPPPPPLLPCPPPLHPLCSFSVIFFSFSF